jgi:NADH-quinone oxidoreductase subunit M
MLWMYQRVFFGPITNPENKKLVDLNGRELAYLLPLVLLCFWIGLYPRPFFRILEKPVDYVVRQVEPDYARAASWPVAVTPSKQVAEIED